MMRVCKKCLLREMEKADQEMIAKYKAAIKQADQVSPEKYEERLSVCVACDKLNAGTCQACGCYVELRAAAKISRCPHKKW